jgi:hypothetical protein
VLAIASATLIAQIQPAQKDVHFRLDDNLVHVSASVNGAPVSAVLDSGTGGVLLDLAAAERLHVVQGASSGSAVGGGSGAQQLFPLKISNVEVGGAQLSNVSGFALDLQRLSKSAGFPIEVLVGEPLFGSHIVKINYPARVIELQPSESSVTCRAPIPLTLSNGVPLAEVTIRAVKDGPSLSLHLIVDLGTRHFAAMIGGPFLKTAAGKTLLKTGLQQQIGTGTGGMISGTIVRVPELQVGEKRYSELEVALTDEVKAFETGFADGSLGVPLWSSSVVTFDYPHHSLCIEQPSQPAGPAT